MNEKFKEILQARGWLAFDTLIFDNSIELKIRTTGGLIAFDKTANIFISVLPNDHSQTTKTRGIVAVDNEPERDMLSDFAAISLSGIDNLQRYNMSAYSLKGDMLRTDITSLTVPNIKTLLASSPEVIKKQIVTGSVNGYPRDTDVYDMGNDTYLLKEYSDVFNAKQAQFKQFLVSNFNFVSGDLV